MAIYKLIPLCFILFSSIVSWAKTVLPEPIFALKDTANPVWAARGMVAAPEPLAAKIGLNILKKGGNAVDAAVAIGYALAVTHPRAGNLGGGGFMLIYLRRTKKMIAIDYRETAPQATKVKLYLDENKKPVADRTRYHGLAIGVPGTVMGLEQARVKYGTMKRMDLMKPAIRLAQKGFRLSYALSQSLNQAATRFKRFPQAKHVFTKKNGQPYRPKEKWRQKELAQSLSQIAQYGTRAFYRGSIAKKIIQTVEKYGGVMTLEDLAQYKAVQREPVQGHYDVYDIFAMPPPSSGGVHLVQLLNTLQHFPLADWGHNTAQTLHVMAEAMKYAYADRSYYLGDPDFVQVPIRQLTHPKYGRYIAKRINTKRAQPSIKMSPNRSFIKESDQTTHFSVIDKDGNAVSNTYTLNFSFGSGLVAEGTGIILNNEIDDFSIKKGVANAYGLIGGKANQIAPKKRPLSSMTPFIALHQDNVFLVGGTPGGSRIITTCLQLILNVITHKMNPAEAVQAPRMHHQWQPDKIQVEQSLSQDTTALLDRKGHIIQVQGAMGDAQLIMKNRNGLWGASDPRGYGVSLGY
tara:strand:- start:28787 stop:30511 length:1725 start_codon:yes stop_codon:yes gene_type:complete